MSQDEEDNTLSEDEWEMLVELFEGNGFSYKGNIFNQIYHPTGGEQE